MTVRKRIIFISAILFFLVPLVLKAEESAIQPELIDEDMPWWVYLWAGILVAGVASMALKSIKQAIRKPEEDKEPEESQQSQKD